MRKFQDKCRCGEPAAIPVMIHGVTVWLCEACKQKARKAVVDDGRNLNAHDMHRIMCKSSRTRVYERV